MLWSFARRSSGAPPLTLYWAFAWATAEMEMAAAAVIPETREGDPVTLTVRSPSQADDLLDRFREYNQGGANVTMLILRIARRVECRMRCSDQCRGRDPISL